MGQTGSIVSNDSAQIMRMLSNAFDDFCPAERRGWSYAPEALLERIDGESTYMQDKLNAGVYKAGWAPSQSAYEERCRDVFAACVGWIVDEADLAASITTSICSRQATVPSCWARP